MQLEPPVDKEKQVYKVKLVRLVILEPQVVLVRQVLLEKLVQLGHQAYRDKLVQLEALAAVVPLA